MIHDATKTECLRYTYILKIDNRGVKSKYYGHKKILYVGQTINLVRRVKEHLVGINSQFLFRNFRQARKQLVFVSYVFGNEYDAMAEELTIKGMSQPQKEALIRSDRNMLIHYIPLKVIILKKHEALDEQTALRM